MEMKLIFLLLALMLVLVPTASAETVNGRVMKGDAALSHLPITLGLVTKGGLVDVLSTNTDSNGSFKFENLRSNTSYLMSFPFGNKIHRIPLTGTELQIDLAGEITGKVLHKNGTTLQNKSVILEDEFGEIEKTSSGSDGSFSFKDLVVGQAYQLTAMVGGVEFTSTVSAPAEATLKVLDTTSEDSIIRVEYHDIILKPLEGMLEVTEYLIFVNSDGDVYTGSELYVALPSNRKLTKSNIMQCCFVEEENHALVNPMDAIFPDGVFHLNVNYKIPIAGASQSFRKEVKYPTERLAIYVLDNGISISEDTVDLEVEGRRYKTIIKENLQTDSIVEIDISGLTPLRIAKKSGRSSYLLIAGIVAVGSLALVLLTKRFR